MLGAQVPPVVTDDEKVPAAEEAAGTETPKGPQTVEEANAYWQKRMSGKDRANAEENRVLREQLAAAEAKATAAPGAAGQPGTGPDPERQRLERELEAERAARLIDQRKAKYPLAAETLDDAAIAAAGEAKLAALQARLDEGTAPGTYIVPTGPKKAAPALAKKPLAEMSREELEAELKSASGPYKTWLEDTNG